VLEEHRRHSGVAEDALAFAEGDWLVVTTIGMAQNAAAEKQEQMRRHCNLI
jgi:hypothetical protein